MTVVSDSQFATIYVKDPKYHGRTKHLEAKNNFKEILLHEEEMILNIYLYVK